MSLSECLAKAGKNITAEDRAAIESMASELRKGGMNERAAEVAAVRSQMEKVTEQRYALARDMVQSAGTPSLPGGEAAPRENASDAATLTAAMKLAAEQPDLIVTLPGSDESLSVIDAMLRIAEEHKQDNQWADLVKVAANCFLDG